MARFIPKVSVGVFSALLLALSLTSVATAQRNLYVASDPSQSISIFDMDVDTGALTVNGNSPVTATNGPTWTVIEPSGRFLYSSNQSQDSVSAYAIDQDTGALTEVSTLSTGDTPLAIAVDPSGSFVYVASYTTELIYVYAINQTTGSLTAVGSPVDVGGPPHSIAIDPAGNYLYVSRPNTNDLVSFAINDSTGGLTVTGDPISTGITPEALVLTPDGQNLYVMNTFQHNISAYRVDPSSGLLTANGSDTEIGLEPYRIAVDPAGRYLYTANYAGNSISTLSIDQTTGQLSFVNSDVVENTASNVVISPNGKYLYSTSYTDQTVDSFSIDGSNGTLTQFGSPLDVGSHPYYQAVAITPNQAPVGAISVHKDVVGLISSFGASGSSDSDGTVVSYSWDFGDGTSRVTTAPRTHHTYTVAGTYTASVTLTDNEGCSDTQIWASITAYCNGGDAAKASTEVTIANAPSTTTQPEQGVLSVSKLSVGSSSRSVKVGLSCSAGVCSGVAKVVTRRKYRSGGSHKRRFVTLGKASYTVTAGTDKTVTVKFSRTKLKKLTQGGRKALKVALKLTNTATGAVTTKNFTIKKKKRKRK